MSFQTMYHEVNVNRDQLLNLFLHQGDLLIQLEGQNIIIDEINNLGIHNVVDGVKVYDLKIRGDSDKPSVSYVDGRGALMAIKDSKAFSLKLELQLQDQFD